MSDERILTLDETKKILGITGTSKDVLINMWYESSYQTLLDIFGISSLLTHAVTDERVQIYDGRKIIVKGFPIDYTETITIKDCNKDTVTGYTFEQENNFLHTIRVLDSDSKPADITDSLAKSFRGQNYNDISSDSEYYYEAFISYTCGYEGADNVPQDLKNLLALMIGAGIAEKNKAGGITQLKIDDKSVTYGSTGDAESESLLIKRIIQKYSLLDITAI